MKPLLILFTLFAAACGNDESYTIGEFCDEGANAACHRSVTCGLSTYDLCFQAFKQGCCLNAGTCKNEFNRPGAQESCLSAYGNLSCSDLSKGVAPAACLMSR